MKANKKQPIVFAILDGWGVGKKDPDINAIECAKTPFFDEMKRKFPYTELGATGIDVGLEKDQMSGSESGHLNIGAGRIVDQDVKKILRVIADGTFFKNPIFLSAVSHAKRYGSKIHLLGLLGNEDSPHSHPDILLALLIFLKKSGLSEKSFIHFFTDGRDSYPKSALEHWARWKNVLKANEYAKCATVCGRFYAMDRTKKWSRLQKAYDALVFGKGERFSSFEDVIDSNYRRGNFDEYVEPAVLLDEGEPVAKIDDNDVVISFNFRSDRARQFAKLFVGTATEKEKNFPQISQRKNLLFVAMTNLGPDLNLKTAFYSNPLISTLPTALSSLRQLYVSETEKFAHVTYFINGGYPDAVGGEERVMVKSPNVKSYAEKPQMSAIEITDVIEKSIERDQYDFIVVNYPNADMVGHTGDFSATTKAVETVDGQLARIFDLLKKEGGTLIVSADHGNADEMIDKESGRIFTFHTKNPVPFLVISSSEKDRNIKLEKGGVLGNIAPTILDIFEMHKPKEMEETSLIK